jgi:histidine triad (HIT) family protein
MIGRKGSGALKVECIFCKISEGKLPADFVFKDGDVFAIRDAHPIAPTHILVIPRKHVPTLADLGADDQAIVSRIMATAVEVAKKVYLSERGYRLVWNCRADGGQTVDHIHLHLLGGRQMKWPPG